MRANPRPRHRILRAVLAGTLLGAVMSTAAATGAGASPTQIGYVRLAHLSPDTPEVDVYLDAVSQHMPQQVFHGVGYGTVSGYLPLPVGEYTVAMRPSGASPSTPPVITTTVTVAADHAYTVAGVGKHADLGLRVISDDLTAPRGSHAKVRIVQASVSAPLIDVSLSDGETVADNVAFATTTSYRTVAAGTFTLDVKPSTGGSTVPLKVTLHADSVYSLLVIDGKTRLTADLLTDSTRNGPVPTGGVDTGLGGTAPRSGLPVPVLVAIGAVLVLVVAGTGTLLVRRRATAADTWAPRRAPRTERAGSRTL